MEVVAIGIGHDVSRYYKRAVKITDVQDLGDVMINQLTDLFSEKRLCTKIKLNSLNDFLFISNLVYNNLKGISMINAIKIFTEKSPIANEPNLILFYKKQ